jgi:hypothetical protein
MSPHEAQEEGQRELEILLQEIRTLLPGTQLLGGFLLSVPFQARYETLTWTQRSVFLLTFAMTLLALVMFLTPSIYHRLVAPVRDKKRFVAIGTRFVIAGFVPLTISTALSMHLVIGMVLGGRWAWLAAGVLALLLVALWWVLPLSRLHERRG